MKIIFETIYIFIKLFEYVIVIDVILSWLPLFGIKFRPKFIRNLIDPLYNKIKKIIPTIIGNIDFTPIVVIISLEIIREIITKISISLI